jgi:hypothetical protein
MVKRPPENAIVDYVCYLDKPEWCSPETLEEAERMKKENPDLYRHVYLDECSAVGKFFYNFGKHLRIEPYRLESGAVLYGSLDHGTTAPTSFGLWYRDKDKRPVRLMTYYKAGLSASENARAIATEIQSFPWTGGQPPVTVWADPSMWTKVKLEKDFQPAAIEYYEQVFREVFAGNRIQTCFVRGNNDRKNTCAIVREYFGTTDGVPNSYYFDKHNKAYEELIPQQQSDKYNEEVFDTSLEDHIADDTCYGLCGLRGTAGIVARPRDRDANAIIARMNRQGKIGVTGI